LQVNYIICILHHHKFLILFCGQICTTHCDTIIILEFYTEDGSSMSLQKLVPTHQTTTRHYIPEK
jgi:hypothetical protein